MPILEIIRLCGVTVDQGQPRDVGRGLCGIGAIGMGPDPAGVLALPRIPERSLIAPDPRIGGIETVVPIRNEIFILVPGKNIGKKSREFPVIVATLGQNTHGPMTWPERNKRTVVAIH